MSKQDNDAAPPPYSASAFPTTSSIPQLPYQPPSPLGPTSHLATHLSTLSARLRETQTARTTQQAFADLDLVERIVPHIESFLADMVAHETTTSSSPRAELTIVPAPAVSHTWTLSGAAERRREGELVHLVRLAVPVPFREVDEKGQPRGDHNGGGGDAKGSGVVGAGAAGGVVASSSSLRPERDWTSTQFDEWGRWDEDAEAAAAASADGGGLQTPSSLSWWRDERMAQRLAAYLQPRPPVKTERREIQAAVVQVREEKKGGWGLWRRKTNSAVVTPSSSGVDRLPTTSIATTPFSGVEQADRVKMSVRADEVTFRRENDFGVWESLNGWGIVVVIQVR